MNNRQKQHMNNSLLAIQAEEKCYDDIEQLISKYEDFLNDINYKSGFLEMAEVLFNLFIYEKLFTYKRDDFTKLGLFNSLKYYFTQLLNNVENSKDVTTLENRITQNINKYFSCFNLSIFQLGSNRELLFNEILALEDSNEFKIKLYYALLFSLFEELDEIQTLRMIDDALVDYDFNYKIPTERKHFAYEVYRQVEYIPDFSNVKVGQVWCGKNRRADFIKALRLKPMPAGKHSRTSQERSITSFCNWQDDEDAQQLTLVEIYPSQLTIKSSRTHKYEKYIETILLYHLQAKDRTESFNSTINRFFVDINALPKTYRKTPIYDYQNIIDELHITETELECNLKHFRKKIKENLHDIVEDNLKYIKEKKLINFNTSLVIVVGGKHILLDDVKEVLGLSISEVYEMIDVANEYAFNKVSEKDTNRGIKLKSMLDAKIHNKTNEVNVEYEKYIKEQYGWSYTYEGLFFSKYYDVEYRNITWDEYNEAKVELNKILVESMRKSVTKKDQSLKRKYDEQGNEEIVRLEKNEEAEVLYNNKVIDIDSIIPHRQFKYPDSFIYCVDTFIDKELKI